MTNQTVIHSTKTYKFNPGFQSDDEAVQNFIVRKGEFERIMDAYLGRDAGAGPRVLVVAPRGAGKTTLCRRVLAEIHRSAELSAGWHPIFLGEESYSVTSPGEFFLECIFHLHERSPELEMESEYEEALQLSDEEQLVDRTLAILRSFSQRTGKRLLVIVENFQIILDDQIGSGAKVLLKQLRNDQLFGILATSVSQSDTGDSDLWPSDFLQVLLRPLTLEECHALWKALTDHDVKRERIRPLQILTGGSPRLLHILAEFMRSPSLRNLMENLNLLIDQNTEYFKSQLDALPAIERKVFAALLDAWDPSTAKQIAEAARVNTNIASAMLARLTTRGAVIKEPGRGRTAIYYAAERLFNIYYLMRRRSHPSSRVHALVSFMTEYYDRDELIDTAAILAREACALRPDNRTDYHSTFDAILAKAPKAVRAQILKQTPPDFMSSFQEHRKAEYGTILTSTSEASLDGSDGDSHLRAILGRARRAAERDDLVEALRLLNSATETHPDSPEVWMQLFVARLQGDEFEEAIAAARKLRALQGNDAWGHAIEGLAQAAAGRTGGAKAAFERALDVDQSNPVALIELAEIHEHDGDVGRAVQLYQRAREQDALSDGARARFSRLLAREGKDSEAESLLKEVVDDSDAVLSRRALVELLSDLDRRAEGIQVLKSAAEAGNGWQSWADFGGFLLAQGEEVVTAKKALANAVELGADEPSVFRQLASATLKDRGSNASVADIAADVTRRFPTNPAAWLEAASIYRMLDSKERAEASVRSAIELDGGARAWVQLGRLLQAEPARAAEAEEAFRKAVECSNGPHVCGPSKELANFLVHRGEDQAAKVVLDDALEKNRDCYCCTVAQAEIATRSGDRQSARVWYEAALEIDGEGIQALTELSRIVSHEEAKELIERALAAAPQDARSLLARAQTGDGDVETQIKDARESLRLRPRFTEAHLFLIPILAKKGDLDEAFNHLKAALNELPTRRELIPTFVDATMVVAASEVGERVSRLIEEHPYGSTMEPLAVALKLRRGEKPVVAKEVMDVAEDIANRMGDGDTVRAKTIG